MADKIPCGGFTYDETQFSFENKKLKYIGTGDANVDGMLKADGSTAMTGNLQMDGNAIVGVASISNTDNVLALESEVSVNNHKVTDLLNPTEAQDAATKSYVDSILPAFTEADNGKVLGIINGSLAWIKI